MTDLTPLMQSHEPRRNWEQTWQTVILFLVGFYPNRVDRNIISEMRSAHGEDRQHATIVGRGIDGIDFS